MHSTCGSMYLVLHTTASEGRITFCVTQELAHMPSGGQQYLLTSAFCAISNMQSMFIRMKGKLVTVSQGTKGQGTRRSGVFGQDRA